MVISRKMKKSTFDYSIKCGESLISVRQNIKYLGLNIDDKFNLKEHIKIVELKAVCAVDILAKLKHYLSRYILLQLYHALIDCHLIYAIPVWGSTFHTYFDKYIANQNKAVKTIAKLNGMILCTTICVYLNSLKCINSKLQKLCTASMQKNILLL